MLKILVPALAVVLSGAAYAAPASQQMIDSYVQNCTDNAVHIPFPHGESDLVGNPKLKSYCTCFSAKFAARAAKVTDVTATMSRDDLQKTVNEEKEMRNSCRAANGLQLIKK